MAESHLQRRIRRRLEEAVGGWWTKIHVSEFQSQGIPDLIGCVEGLFFALEVKMEGEEPSAIQDFVMGQIRAQGGCSLVVTSPEQAIAIVRRRVNAAFGTRRRSV